MSILQHKTVWIPIPGSNNVAHAQYVDNYLCASHNRQYVRSDANAHQAGLEKAQMPCHDLEDGVSFTKFAGLELDGNALTARVSRRRIWILYFGITCVLALSELSGAQLECMLGHITWAMLVRRECLFPSFVRVMTLYAYIAKKRHLSGTACVQS